MFLLTRTGLSYLTSEAFGGIILVSLEKNERSSTQRPGRQTWLLWIIVTAHARDLRKSREKREVKDGAAH